MEQALVSLWQNGEWGGVDKHLEHPGAEGRDCYTQRRARKEREALSLESVSSILLVHVGPHPSRILAR